MEANEIERAIGVSHGYVHAIAMIKHQIGVMRYFPIPPRHKRRRIAREAKIKPLQIIQERLEGDLRRLQAAMKST